MSLDFAIGQEEYLYRGLNAYWIKADGSISSGAFKTKKGYGGVSVDRSGYRNEVECIKNLLRFDGVCRIKNKDVYACNAISVYCPSTSNEFHSEIHKSETEIPLTPSQSKKLADYSTLVRK